MQLQQPLRILITGGCGFIGSNLVNKFVEQYPNYFFVNLDILYYCASLKNIQVSGRPNYKFIKGNLTDYNLLRFILAEYEINTVIHLAAQSHVDNSFSNPLQYTQDNILGTHTLLEACKDHGKITRFIHVSTDEVYGETLHDTKMNEESVLCPTNPYAATKAAAELIAMSYYHSFKMPIIITRGNNVYGIYQYPEKLIPRFIMLLKAGKKMTIQGDGSNRRSFIHVDDVVSAFDTILHKGRIGEIYNIGSMTEYSVMDVARILVKKMMNCGDECDEVSKYIEYIKDRNFNDKRYYITNDKIIELGWRQTIDFEDGIEQCIEWYCDPANHNHWQN